MSLARRGRDNAIVMVSIGDRPWSQRTGETFRQYAEQCGAIFCVHRTTPSEFGYPFEELADDPGRPNKAAYAAKTYVGWHYLEVLGYKKVLVVDDTCCIRPESPDVFDSVPNGACGYTRSSRRHAADSFAYIEGFVSSHGKAGVDFDQAEYMNSAVMVYTSGMRHALSLSRIWAHRDLLFASKPHQTLTYYLLKSAGVRLVKLSKKWNKVPGVAALSTEDRRRMTSVYPYLQDGAYIYHITGAYRHRALLVRQLADALLQGAGGD